MLKNIELAIPTMFLANLVTIFLHINLGGMFLATLMIIPIINLALGWYLFKGKSPKASFPISIISGLSFTVVASIIFCKLIPLGYGFFLGVVGLAFISTSFLLIMFNSKQQDPDYVRYFNGLKLRHVIYSVCLLISTLIPDTTILNIKYSNDPERLRLETAVLENPGKSQYIEELNAYKKAH